ncbi:MAG TPA: hypothetical protein VGN37_26915 [Actinocatenispora sp.]
MTGGTTGRALAVRCLVLLEFVVGVSAVGGAIALIGGGAGIPDRALARTPFTSWVVPGIALFAVVAVPMLAAASAYAWAPRMFWGLSVTAGLALLAWMAAEIALVREFSSLQPMMIVVGGVVLALASAAGPAPSRAAPTLPADAPAGTPDVPARHTTTSKR